MTGDRFCVIGDVHGEPSKLAPVLSASLRAGYKTILCGDYIDRGPDSAQVLDLLADAQDASRGNLVLLKGNHEHALLAFLDGGSHRQFLAYGGLTTVRSYMQDGDEPSLDAFRDTFPTRHRLLLEGLEPYFETAEMLVSHCGYSPKDVASRDPRYMYENGDPSIFRAGVARPDKTVICGHYVQPGTAPFDDGGLICLDTGCGTRTEGGLTSVTMPGRHFETYCGIALE